MSASASALRAASVSRSRANSKPGPTRWRPAASRLPARASNVRAAEAWSMRSPNGKARPRRVHRRGRAGRSGPDDLRAERVDRLGEGGAGLRWQTGGGEDVDERPDHGVVHVTGDRLPVGGGDGAVLAAEEVDRPGGEALARDEVERPEEVALLPVPVGPVEVRGHGRDAETSRVELPDDVRPHVVPVGVEVDEHVPDVDAVDLRGGGDLIGRVVPAVTDADHRPLLPAGRGGPGAGRGADLLGEPVLSDEQDHDPDRGGDSGAVPDAVEEQEERGHSPPPPEDEPPPESEPPE